MGEDGLFNIWDYLLVGMIILTHRLLDLVLPPATDSGDLQNMVLFTQFWSSGIWAVMEMSWAALSMLNWWVLAPALAINGALFLFQLAVSLWLFFKSIVSLPFISK